MRTAGWKVITVFSWGAPRIKARHSTAKIYKTGLGRTDKSSTRIEEEVRSKKGIFRTNASAEL